MATKRKNAGSGSRYGGRYGGSPYGASYARGAQSPAGEAYGRAAAYASALNSQPVASAPSYSSYGGGGGGGGGGAYDPTADPTYQAYIRGLDLEEAQRRQSVMARRSALRANQDVMLSESARQGDLQREGIAGNYESRGLFLSGGRLQDQARSQANQLGNEGRIRSDTARQISEDALELAQVLAQIQLKRQNAALGLFD